eukprot:CAMPEP_0201260598 /NCGR_PEP_ID=MMETSP0853-20130426/4884_1 /ASSEMBLY_ACC=CAM_ASM_000640 /TAXON_ID=183588 /ORGANISM="Pseudo-nitzschia fraudulenta, Strain WWA7" /LENGTH=39 /DNA_ID= /DNA_START= /DNA_END= /DNA_ORIENTATION=
MGIFFLQIMSACQPFYGMDGRLVSRTDRLQGTGLQDDDV